jgi:hypothetical protein
MDMIVHQLNKKIFNNINMNTNITSDGTGINSFSLFAIQHSWTGFSGTATIILQGSNTSIGINETPIWSDIDTFNITGATGNRLINYEKAGFAQVRLVFTQTSASGILLSTMNAKVL